MTKDDAKQIVKTITYLCGRPGMYVKDISLEGVAAYLDGFMAGISDISSDDEMLTYSWKLWIGKKFGIWHSGWSWNRSLLHTSGSSDEALSLLPDLFEKFLEDYTNIGFKGIEDAHQEHFKIYEEKYGYVNVGPEQTFTKNP